MSGNLFATRLFIYSHSHLCFLRRRGSFLKKGREFSKERGVGSFLSRGVSFLKKGREFSGEEREFSKEGEGVF